MPANKIIHYNPSLKEKARILRKNSTLSEIILWKKIKNKSLGYEFHRQVPLDNFIVDFYCHGLNLAIEIDGNTHVTILKRMKQGRNNWKNTEFALSDLVTMM